MNVNETLLLYYEEGTALLDLLRVHSEMVARKALALAVGAGLDVDREFVWNAAMLHDIGIFRCDAPSILCHGSEPYLRHGLIGGELMRGLGKAEIARVCERHTGSGLTAVEINAQSLPLPHEDFLPETLEEKLICFADKFYSKSGDPRVEKTFASARASMAKFGPGSLTRFDAMAALFKVGAG